MPRREAEYWLSQWKDLMYCAKHKRYYRIDSQCQLCQGEEPQVAEEETDNSRLQNCPRCKETSLYFNRFKRLWECFNPECQRDFTMREFSDLVGQQLAPDEGLKIRRQVSRGAQRCPVCGQKMLSWNIVTSEYECLNWKCKRTFTPNELRQARGTVSGTPFLLLTLMCLAIIGYAVYQFNELERAAAIGLISAASIGAIWSIGTLTKLLRYGPLRANFGMAFFSFIMILLVCGTVFWVTESSQNKLDAKEQELVTMQGQLSTTKADLDNTKSKLSTTTADLDSAKSKMSQLENSIADLNRQLGSTSNTIEGLQNTVNQLQAEIDLYHSSGIFVYSGKQPQYTIGGGRMPVLRENPLAVDVSSNVVRNFILNDHTDCITYTNDFSCGNFAELLHNNAEAAGIRTAFVGADLSSGPGHAFNAFRTTDIGLIYVDCEGSSSGNCYNDKTVTAKVAGCLTFTDMQGTKRWDDMCTVTRVKLYW